MDFLQFPLPGIAQELAASAELVANIDNQPDLEKGRGKRRKIANKFYTSSAFWRHNDQDDWKDDNMGTAGTAGV